MSDIVQTQSQLLSSFADNNAGLITPQNIRNFVVSIPTLASGISYLGAVATNAGIGPTFSNGNTQFTTRSFHTCRQTIASIQVGISNWYVNTQNGNTGSGVETGPGAAASVQCAIESPLGATPLLVTWSGSVSGVIPNAATVLSDPFSINITAGQQFAIRIFYSNPSGIPFTTYYQPYSGEGMEYGSSVTNKTVSGTVGANGVMFLPSLLIGATQKATVMLLGDSRMAGPEVAEQTCDRGECAKSIGPFLAYGNYGVATDRLQWMVGSFTLRAQLAQYYTHCIISAGINDYTNGSATNANTTTNLAKLITMLPASMNKYVTTILPVTNSSDSWVNNQSIQNGTQNNYRIAENNTRRAGVVGAVGCFDVTDVIESGRDSGLYALMSYSSDGEHLTLLGQQVVQRSHVVNPALFRLSN